MIVSNNSKYGLYDCWKCLCEVCTRIDCPKTVRRLSKFNHCFRMAQRGCCPTVKCDWFTHKEKRRIYKVKSKHSKKDTVIELLLEIRSRLEEQGGGAGKE